MSLLLRLTQVFLFLPRYSNSSFRAMPLCEKHCWQIRAYLQQGWTDKLHGSCAPWCVLHWILLSCYKCDWKGLANRETSFRAKLLIRPEIYHLFCGPSPTRYSMTRSIAPLSLGRMGLANGGPGGCMPAKTTHTQSLKAAQRQMHSYLPVSKRTYLHLVLVSQGSGASPLAGQRWGDQISPEVLLELREEHVLSGEQQRMTWQLVSVHFFIYIILHKYRILLLPLLVGVCVCMCATLPTGVPPGPSRGLAPPAVIATGVPMGPSATPRCRISV